MTTALARNTNQSLWTQFCNWITSTENRIYIGWFGVLMFPTSPVWEGVINYESNLCKKYKKLHKHYYLVLKTTKISVLTATTVYIIAFIAAPPVDIKVLVSFISKSFLHKKLLCDGIREPVSGSFLYGNNIITGAVVPLSNAIGLHLYPIWEAASIDEWLYNGGPYELIVCHFFIGICAYMGREWELSYRLKSRTKIYAVAYSAPVAAATAVFIIYPIGQGYHLMTKKSLKKLTFNFMLVFQAEHNILMHPFHMLGVAGVFGGALFSAMHNVLDLCHLKRFFSYVGSLVTSSIIRETTEQESANEGYRFGQETETYSIVAAHGYFGRLLWQYSSFNNSRSLHFALAVFPVIGIWFTSLGISTMAFNLNGLIDHGLTSIVDSNARVISSWADIINRANLGFEVMHIEQECP
uniref:photosystem II protein D1 n=1 Tax=Cephaleuros karstenii TaxID=1985640 RepID=UPI001EDE3DC3|nr:photosystem II protein D1 [Cephaleuros karstenii]UIB39084.1 photosystem II protein D1 [Cephaleuros karstenii]